MPSPSAAPSPELRSAHACLATSTEAVQATDIRTSDQEREQVVERLQFALAQGRLDLEETSTRVAAAYAACYRAEFAPLLADLPDEPAGPVPWARAPAWAAIWTSTVWRARIAVLGTSADAPPTTVQCRFAMLVALLALGWLAACAVLAAAGVAA
jgi:hypothetical protein